MLRANPKIQRQVLQLLDVAVSLASFELAFLIRSKLFPSLSEHVLLLLAIAAIWWAIFRMQGTYISQRFTSLGTELRRVVQTVGLGTLILIAGIFLFKVHYVPRSAIVLFVPLNLTLLFGNRLLVYLGIRQARKRGYDRKRVLIIGAGDRGRRFVEEVSRHLDWGLDIVGFVEKDRSRVGERFCGAKILGTPEDLPRLLRELLIDEVIFTVSSRNLGDIRDMMEVCERYGIVYRLVSDFFRGLTSRIHADVVHGVPIISFYRVPQADWQVVVKRIMDIVASSLGLVLLAPILGVIALAVKLTSKGPVLYKWRVLGENGRPFVGYKFRTMVPNADELKEKLLEKNEMRGPVFKMKHDPRVTKIGKLLRKYSLDELPQLWSVLKGDMSLVGPHPPLQNEVEKFEDWHLRKLSVKPGVTGPWQVNGRGRVKDFDRWVRMELEYIDRWSLWLDLKILAKTVVVVLKGTGV